MATAADIFNYLTNNALHFRVLTHPPVFSTQELARLNYVMSDEVAEHAVFKADYRFIMAVVPAGTVVSERALRQLLHVRELVRASAWDIERLFPECEIGAAPILGNLFGIPVIVDSSFEKRERIVFFVCARTTSVMMNWREYKNAVDPIVAAIAGSPAKGNAAELLEEPYAQNV